MNDTFKYQTATDPQELARYLEVLSEGVKAGALTVAEGHMSFTIQPKGLIDMGLKVRRKQGRTRVSLELSWSETGLEGRP
ncbi:MAG: amphi-Trp domain-containing protein [Deltaproteobacteria bacterium]|nr:amphi-Trp domain-containing protein [Deltaproteobacteria bacterium]